MSYITPQCTHIERDVTCNISSDKRDTTIYACRNINKAFYLEHLIQWFALPDVF